MVINCAAWPEEAATAATPPSRAAIRFSKTSTVGWVNKSLSDTESWIGREAYIHDTTIDVAKLLEAEQAGAMRAVVEHITLRVS